VPVVTPVTTPVVGATAATLVLALLHEPPVAAFERVVVADWQTVAVPEMAYETGADITEIACDA
jgi:hypothetical protein